MIIAGNHDLSFDKSFWEGDPNNLLRFGVKLDEEKKALAELGKESVVDLLDGCIYLLDSHVTICGVKIHGSPW